MCASIALISYSHLSATYLCTHPSPSLPAVLLHLTPPPLFQLLVGWSPSHGHGQGDQCSRQVCHFVGRSSAQQHHPLQGVRWKGLPVSPAYQASCMMTLQGCGCTHGPCQLLGRRMLMILFVSKLQITCWHPVIVPYLSAIP